MCHTFHFHSSQTQAALDNPKRVNKRNSANESDDFTAFSGDEDDDIMDLDAPQPTR